MSTETKELTPSVFFKALADDIRLKSILLIAIEKEVCVCELMVALAEESQPKVSRHLAQLKKLGLLTDRKIQQWVFYSLNPTLSEWMKATITDTLSQNKDYIAKELNRLHDMGDRPQRVSQCC